MTKIDPPIWYNVNTDARIWSGHADSAHKKEWLRAPAGIRAISEYQGSYQFKEVMVDESLGGKDERKDDPGYPQYWIRIEDVSLEKYNPDPEDDGDDVPPSVVTGDAELGAAVRKIVTLIAEIFIRS